MNVLLIKKRGQPTLKHVIYTYEHGFGYAWLAQEVGHIKTFLYLLKTRLKDCAVQKLLLYKRQVADGAKILVNTL